MPAEPPRLENELRPSGRRAPRQLVIVAIAIIVWALIGNATFATLIGAYALSWTAINITVVRWPRSWRRRLPRPLILAIIVVGVAVPLIELWDARAAFLENESLLGWQTRLSDRDRIQDTPSIAPPVVFADHPQTFYVYAPGAEVLEARFAGRYHPSEPLGHGMFRVRYDPRQDGLIHEGDVDVALRIDRDVTHRTLIGIRRVAHPRGLRPSPSRARVAATSEETDQLFILDGRGLEETIDVGDGPTDCAFLDEDTLAVVHRYDALAVVSRTGELRQEIPLPSQLHIASLNGRLAISLDTPAEPRLAQVIEGEVSYIELDEPAEHVVYGPDTSTIIISQRRAARLVRLPERQVLELGRPAITMARSPDGKTLYVATTDYVSSGTPHLGNHFIQDQILEVDVEAWRVKRRHLTARRSPRQGTAGSMDIGVSPMGIDAFSSGELVAFAGSSDVWMGSIDAPTNIVLDPIPTPTSVARLADERVVVSSAAAGAFVILRDGELERLVSIAPPDDVLLRDHPEALQRRLGEHAFYEGTRSGVSCQSCHAHADTDYVLRNIGDQRLTPTAPVRGIIGTAPYLRDASYPQIRDLEHLSTSLLNGFRRRAPARGLNLEAFITGLERRPPARPDALDEQRRGLEIFVRAGCETCHSFPAFTNLGQHAHVTIFGDDGHLEPDAILDTPSLLGVSRRGPYLADGRARDLQAVLIEHNAANQHGDTRTLSEPDRQDLIAFLESL